MGDKIKKQLNPLHLLLFKQHYPEQASLLDQAIDKGDTQQVEQLLKPLYEKLTGFGNIPSDEILRPLTNQTVMPDATRTVGTITPAMQQEYNIGQQGGAIGLLGGNAQNPDEAKRQLEKALDEKAAQLYSQRDFFDRLSLAGKTVTQTITDIGLGVMETVGLLMGGSAKIFGHDDAAQSILEGVSQMGDVIRTVSKLSRGITPEDELIMNRQLEYQILNGLTFTGTFLLGGAVTSGLPKVAGYGLRSILATQESTRDALRSYEETKNIDVALATYVSNLPADFSEFVIDKLVPPVRASLKGMTPLYRKAIDTIVGGAQGFIFEGGQEVFQQWWHNLTARELYDNNRRLTEGLDNSFTVGGLVGLLFGAAFRLTTMKLNDPTLTSRERALLERSRTEMSGILSKFDLNRHIDETITPEMPIIRHDPDTNPLISQAIEKLQKPAVREMQALNGATIQLDEFELAKQRALEQMQSAPTTLHKVKPLIDYTLTLSKGQLQSLSDFTTHISSTFGEQFLPIATTLYGLARSPIGLAFLSYLSNNPDIPNLLSDPSVTSAFILPIAFAERIGFGKDLIVGHIRTNTDEELAVIHPDGYNFTEQFWSDIDQAITNIQNGVSANFEGRLSDYLVFPSSVKRRQLDKILDIPVTFLTNPNSVPDYIALYDPMRRRAYINITLISQLINHRDELIGQLNNYPLFDIQKAQRVSSIQLAKTLVGNALIHETQHHFDRTFNIGAGGTTDTFMLVSNDIVNAFAERLYTSDISNHIDQVSRRLQTQYGLNIETMLHNFMPDLDKLNRLDPRDFANMSDEEYRNNLELLLDILSNFPSSPALDNALQYIAENYRNRQAVIDVLVNNIEPLLSQRIEYYLGIASFQQVLRTIQNLATNRPSAWGKALVVAMDYANYLADKLNMTPFYKDIGNLFYLSIGGEARAHFIEGFNTARDLKMPLPSIQDFPSATIEIQPPQLQNVDMRQMTHEMMNTFFNEFTDTLNKAISEYGSEYLPVLEYIGEEMRQQGYAAGFDRDGAFIIMFKAMSPSSVRDSITAYYKKRNAADVAFQFERLFKYSGKTVPFAAIWNVVKDGKYNDVIPKAQDNLDDILTQVEEDIKKSDKPKPEIDAVLLTHYADLSRRVYKQDYPQTIILDPVFAHDNMQSYSTKYSGAIDTPRVFFYPLATPMFYADTLEGQVVDGAKQPYHIVLPTQDIYFLTKVGNYEANPLGLDGDPDIIYKILRKKGYKGAIYETSTGEYHLVTFVPLKAYKPPTIKVNITAATSNPEYSEASQLTAQFAEAMNSNIYDKESADKIKALTEQVVVEELDKLPPAIASNIETIPTIAIFGEQSVEPSTAVDLTGDISRFPDILRAMAQAGQRLGQLSVHVLLEGVKPTGVQYGQVLEDKSQWQPMVTVNFKTLNPNDAKKVYEAFQKAGYVGVTVDIENNKAYLYNMGDNLDDIQQFIINARRLKKELHRSFGTDFDVRLSDVVFWSFGKEGEWGNVASYDEIADTVLSSAPQVYQTLTQSIPLPKKAYTPNFESILTGNWDLATKMAENRVLRWGSDKAQLHQDVGNGSVYQYVVAYVLGKAMSSGSSIQTIMTQLLQDVPALKPLETTLYGKVLESASQLQNAGINTKEAADIRDAINEAIYRGEPFSITVGDILVTTDNATFDKAKNRAILIEPNTPYNAAQDEEFIRYVKDFIRTEYPTYNLDLALARKRNIGAALQSILKELAPNNIRKQWDSLLLRYRILHADNFLGTITFRNGDNTIATDVTVPLGNAFKIDTYGDNLKALQSLLSMSTMQLLEALRTNELDRYIPQLEPNTLQTVWNTLTQGLTNPNELYDFTTIIGKLLQVGWNVLKAGYILSKAFVNKMVSLFGGGIKAAAELLYKPLRHALLSQDNTNINQATDTDVERISRLTGSPEGATKGFTEENLAETIQKNYDLVDLEAVVREAKGGRVSVLQSKKAAIQLIMNGDVKFEDLDNYAYGSVLPAHYVLAYNVMAQEELGNALEQLRLLKDKYQNKNIPPVDIAQVMEILAPAVRRWAKVRSMISEAGRVVRLGGTEEFNNYVDVLSAYKDMMPPELQAVLDKLQDLPEDKRDTDILGLILYNFILSNPMTQIANVLGNTVNLAANIVADFGVMPITTMKSVAHTFGRAYRLMGEDIKQMLAGEKELENKYVNIRLPKQAYLKLLYPTTLLSIMDAVYRNFATIYKETQLFYKYHPADTLSHYRQIVDTLRADNDNLIGQLTPDVIEQYAQLLDTADHFGRYITYQLPPESQAGQIFQSMSTHPILRFAVLFAKVPINIFKQGLLYWTPLGVIPIGKKIIQGTDTLVTKEDLQQQMRTVTAGTLLFSGLAYGLLNNLLHITGDEPEDEFLRELQRARGFKPYHIYIKQSDGSYKGISYRWAEPIAVVPYLVATIHDLYLSPKYRDKLNDADILQKTSLLLSLVFSYIRDANFMTGINEIFKAGESPKSASEYLERLLVNYFVPNAFTFQTEMPDWLREITGFKLKGKELYVTENIWDRIKNKVGFGAQEGLTPRTDFFGAQQYNVFERTPFRISQAGDIGEDAEIYQFLAKHNLRIPSLRTDDMLQALRVDKSTLERISTVIGQELKPRVKTIIEKVKAKHEQYYDELTEKAQQRYGSDAVQIYKTVGQARIDEAVQRSINEVYNAIKTKVLSQLLPKELRQEALSRLYKGEPDVIMELEPLQHDEIILQIP